MPFSFTPLLLNLIVFRLTAVVAGAPRVPCFFIFGDSLVDNGNNNHLRTTARVNYSPYGVDFPDGPTGRFTNGRNIADVIAQMLGFDDFIPPFANFTTEDALRGINYGSGGDGILDETGSHLDFFGAASPGMKTSGSALVGNYLPKFYASAANSTAQQFAGILIKQYLNQLRRLYYKGARKVAVLPLGRLGCVPQQIADYGSSFSACVEISNDVVRIFDEELKLLLDHLNDRLPNAQFLYTTADVSDNGNVTVLSDPCCPLSAENPGSCAEGGAPCSNRDEYYFWDAFHPTEAAVLLSAEGLFDAVSPLFTRVVDVW
ncbi:hypothetical protein OROMI_016115 [Orobanche minor]